jgi:phosphoglycolate phosphatase
VSVRAAIFDLDGTLADSLADIGGAVNRVLARRGLPTHPVSAYLRFIGDGAEKLIARALPAERQELIMPVLIDYRAEYAAHLADETTLFPGVAELLDGLCERRITLAILSNKPDAPTKALCERLLLRWPFKVIYGERAGVPRKPDPTAALEIAQLLEVRPAECAFVGDTPIDMRTARASGMFGIGVLWGFRSREELLEAGASAIAEHPSEVVAAIRSARA